MKNKAIVLTLTVLLIRLTGFDTNAQTRTESGRETDAIFPKGQRAPTSSFTGTVWVQQLIEPDSVFTIPVGYVTFEPGARSKVT